MIELKFYYGEVIANDDQLAPDATKLSRVKVRLLPEMKDIADIYLPWVRPFFAPGMSALNYGHNPPEVGSKVWCAFPDNTFHDGWYIGGAFIDGFFQPSTVDSTLATITESPTTAYPNLKFYKFKDGTILFENSLTGDVGIYQKSGSYVFIKSTGAVYIYSGSQELKAYNSSGKIHLKATGDITLGNSNESIKIEVTASGNISLENAAGIINLPATGIVSINGGKLEILAGK